MLLFVRSRHLVGQGQQCGSSHSVFIGCVVCRSAVSASFFEWRGEGGLPEVAGVLVAATGAVRLAPAGAQTHRTTQGQDSVHGRRMVGVGGAMQSSAVPPSLCQARRVLSRRDALRATLQVVL